MHMLDVAQNADDKNWHFSEVVQLGEEAHLNTSFKHFIFFVQEFGLIDRRELVPLQELIEKLTSKDRDSNPSR
ncbi:hypothetical protein HPB51_023319 [Rhipicephalus microplus]|uniref:Uncharacterized protein n=1 Tax=Rhipicephalus microplus TaxID=6941 RepID=A0A9J6EIU0_RHIMP|nr:hypothetical protein HPB51_023319 [Rhipicephalus microplus]